MVVVENWVYHDRGCPSQVVLPVVESPAGEREKS
jgi:hypothetical protein